VEVKITLHEAYLRHLSVSHEWRMASKMTARGAHGTYHCQSFVHAVCNNNMDDGIPSLFLQYRDV
jgi:hypothetical protein